MSTRHDERKNSEDKTTENTRHITFVKKILKDGSPCRKCADVQTKLDKNHQMQFIDEVVIADERDPTSQGMEIANKLNVERAPFFVVKEAGKEKVYTVYLKFAKEVLLQSTSSAAIDKEVLENNPDLDFL